jgi:leucyl-tRNA synthetase
VPALQAASFSPPLVFSRFGLSWLALSFEDDQMSRYTPSLLEPHWQACWEQNNTFKTDEDAQKPKFYGLVMFPYPSGDGLHVGHPKSYTAVDILARYKRAKGYRVLHPMGWDAFGLPAERYAVRVGKHPAEVTRANVANFKGQLQRLGFSYDWGREVNTSTPEYYRWTQWIFLKLYEKGLAYLAEVPVNWCPAQGTVLANEEVQDGKYVETGDPVERRLMKQWMLKITAYAEALERDLEGLEWPPGVLEMQRNWIGRSEGAEVHFETEAGDLVVYTTRPDTLWGATFCVVAPEHPTLEKLAKNPEVKAYVAAAKNKADLDRSAAKDKTGVFTGSYAKNPVTGQQIPIWVADYVLMSYGTGAIMAVPGHDERDFAFATSYRLPILRVVEGGELPFAEEGTAVDSGFISGMKTAEAKKAVTAWLEEKGLGKKQVRYKLRDWLFSRQRYWGEPFPILHTESGQIVPVEDLPVLHPELDDFRPTSSGEPPLARAEAWVKASYLGQPARRETNTMPQWAGSCWYYLRYMDSDNTVLPFSPEAEARWGPVDLYVGGAEHAVLHLLYARFWHKVLYDCGLVSTREPFQKLYNQGMILGYSYKDAQGKYYKAESCEERDGGWFVKETGVPLQVQIEKMSKSKLNVVNPDEIVAQFGADTLRMYEMFMGPLDQAAPWQTAGVQGIYRFLERTWRLFVDEQDALRTGTTQTEEVTRALHAAIKEASLGFEAMRFNTPIARMMELVNSCKGEPLTRSAQEDFIKILHPYAPHLAEELWFRLGYRTSVYGEPWPAWDEAVLETAQIEVAVQVSGKLRGTIRVQRDADREQMLAEARANPNVARYLEGKTIVKEIVVPGRMVNFVIK